jgi:hypothetical protein
MLESAKLGMIEKLYERSYDVIRNQLIAAGVSEEDANVVISKAFEDLAACTVVAAREQALQQGLSQEIILKSIGGKTIGKDEARVAMELDTDALSQRQEPCTRKFNDDLRAISN